MEGRKIMGVDPNDIRIDWSQSVESTGSSTVNSEETQNPLISPYTEGANRLISHEIFTYNGNKN